MTWLRLKRDMHIFNNCEQYERGVCVQTSLYQWFYGLYIPMWIKIVVVWFIAMDLLIPGFTWGYWLQACLAVLIQGGLILLTEGSTHRVSSVASTQLTSFSAHQRRVKFFLTTSMDAYNLITIYEACPIKGALMGTLAQYSRKILQKLDQKRWHLIIKAAPSSSVLSQC